MKDKRRKTLKSGERGVSPVVATILLIAIVIVIALIVFLWLRGLTKESVQKFNKNVELACADVSFSADYFATDQVISLSNDGNVPIKNFFVKKIGAGNTDSVKLSEVDPTFVGLPAGQAKDAAFPSIRTNGYDTLKIVPVLLANSNSGEVEHICDDQYGVEVSLTG